MRVALYANERAGRSLSIAELLRIVTEAGHTVAETLRHDRRDRLASASGLDLLVAAGGDGTVAAAVRMAIESGLPVAILPLGTANNVARSLGIGGTLLELATGWAEASWLAIDVGLVQSARGEDLFLEGVGGGLVTAVIKAMDAGGSLDHLDGAARLATANRCYRQLLDTLPARRWTLDVDDQRLAGDFVLVEVLNTMYIGPNLRLSSDVSPLDGLLSVVTVDENQRAELSAFLHAHSAGTAAECSLPSIHARTVRFTSSDDVHVDDSVFAAPDLGVVTLRADRASVTVLV